MPGIRRPQSDRVIFGGKSHLDMIGEVLYVGKHAYSQYDCVIVGLTNKQAIEYIQAGFKVRCSAKGSKFLGEVNEHHVLYLTIDIPRTFDMDKIRLWRLQSSLFKRSHQATIEFTAQYFAFERSEKDGYKLTLEEIYEADDEDSEIDNRSGFEVIKDLEKNVFNDYETYVQGQRDANMPVWSRSRWLQHMGYSVDYQTSSRKITEDDKREHSAYRAHYNRQRGVVEAHMKVGDVMGLNGTEYLIGKIDDLGDEWGVRLDKKFEASIFFRIAK